MKENHRETEAQRPKYALSIRQPWAWLILHAGKDVENRNWRTLFEGRILIHAAKGMTLSEYDEAQELYDFVKPGARLPAKQELPRGGIVGEVEIVKCVTVSDSPWFFGPYGFVLKDAKELPFLECKGRLGFFELGEYPLATCNKP